MICKYCSKEIADDSKVCEFCGKALEKEVKEQETVQETPVQETHVQEAPKEPEVIAAPKKKNGLFIALSIIAVIIVIAVVVVACFGDAIKGAYMKSFSSDEDYFRYVADKSVTSFSENLTDGYGKLVGGVTAEGGASAVKSTFKINVGDKALDLLKESLGEGVNVDLQWLKKVSVDMDVNIKDSLERIFAAVKVDGKTIVDADIFADAKSGDLFVGLLSLSDKYLKISGNTAQAEGNTAVDILGDEEFIKALPSEKVFASLIDRYTSVILDNIKTIEKSSEAVKLGNVEQELTVIDIEITHQDFLNISKAVLETVKTDEELKTVLTDIFKYLEKTDTSYNAEEMIKDFYEDLDESLNGLAEEELQQGVLIITQYVDSSNETVGLKAAFDGQEQISYINLCNGEDFATELKVEKVLTVKGEGTEKKDVVNGKYELILENTKLADITVKDLVEKDDTAKGAIYVAPTSALYELMDMDSDVSTALSIANIQLEIAFDITEKSARVDLNVLSGGELFAGITVTGEEVKAENITVPSGDKVYDETKANEWAQSLDASKIFENLKNAGIPQEFIDLIEMMLTSSQGGSNIATPDYNYGGNAVIDPSYGFGAGGDIMLEPDYAF